MISQKQRMLFDFENKKKRQKVAISTKVLQIWVKRYEDRCCFKIVSGIDTNFLKDTSSSV